MEHICKDCGQVKPLSQFRKNPTYASGHTNQCSTCNNKYQRLRNQTWYLEKRKAICKAYKIKLRQELQLAYGSACACCGETTEEFLELDHIQGGGIKHRRTVKKDLYSFIKQEGYPKDKYRLLCSNCNHSLGVRGYCPHQRKAVAA